MGDPWEDEGFGGEDDWEGKESVEADLEDEREDDELEDEELEAETEDDEE
jgi:hypothetical protein